MATQPSVYQLGDVYKGLLAAGNYPTHLRGDGSDEAAKITYLDRDISAFTYMLHKNFPKTAEVTDRFFEVREIDELERFYTVTLGSNTTGTTADTYDRRIAISNAEAAEVQEGNVFFVHGLFAQVDGNPMVAGQVEPSSGSTLGTNRGPDLGWDTGMFPTGIRFSRTKGPDAGGNYWEDYEQVKVVGVGRPDSAGAGNAMITLERCYMGPNEADDGGRIVNRQLVYSTSGITNTTNGGTGDTNNEHARIQQGDILLRAMPVFREGTNAPDGVHKYPTRDTNYTQEFKYAVSETLESRIQTKKVKSRAGFDAWQTNMWLTKRQANRDREYSHLLGRKLRYSVEGKEEYVSGGVRPYIIKDADHIIIYQGNTITWPGVLDMGKRIFGLGGSQERLGLTGITMDAELRKSFWNEHLFYNKEASKAFNMEVNTLFVSGGKIHLVISQVMEENGYGDEIMCLDVQNPDAFEPVTNAGYNYKVDKGTGDNGIAAPGSQLYKEQVVGMFGLRRRYKTRHCIVDFSNAVTLT